MPSPNLIRKLDSPAYYHVYNRGAGKRVVFYDAVDHRKFLSILRRHLLGAAPNPSHVYPTYDIEIVAYCLMDNHFHLLLYQESDPSALVGYMKSVMTAYSMYFNRRHKASGRLFQGPYKASLIDSESYLAHITRYIHMNPQAYATYHWSSLRYYLGEERSSLISPNRATSMNPAQYQRFLAEYEGRRAELKELFAHLL